MAAACAALWGAVRVGSRFIATTSVVENSRTAAKRARKIWLDLTGRPASAEIVATRGEKVLPLDEGHHSRHCEQQREEC